MSIADKKYSNVDKKTAEILVEAKLLLEEEGYEVSKPREKSIARELMNVATFINSRAIDFSLGLETSYPSSSNNNLASTSISAVFLSTFEYFLSAMLILQYEHR